MGVVRIRSWRGARRYQRGGWGEDNVSPSGAKMPVHDCEQGVALLTRESQAAAVHQHQTALLRRQVNGIGPQPDVLVWIRSIAQPAERRCGPVLLHGHAEAPEQEGRQVLAREGAGLRTVQQPVQSGQPMRRGRPHYPLAPARGRAA